MADQDPYVVFTPSGKRGRVPAGTPVLQAARRFGVDLDSVCGGRGICSRCQVEPSFGPFPKHGITALHESLSAWNSVEERYDRIRGLKSGRRLGCQARIQGDVVIDVPSESQVHKQVVRKSADERPVEMDPAVRLHFVEVSQPDMHHPSGDLERVQEALARQWGIDDAEIDIPVLRSLQKLLRQGDWQITLAVHRDGISPPRILAAWPGFFDAGIYGLAIDLGSTTIAAHLCSLSDGSVAASSGIMNPQIRFGEDLMSRVSYAMMNPAGSDEMTIAVREALDSLITAVASEAGIDRQQILEAVIVCNPVMHHLLLGIDPVELGQAPFALATAAALSTDAKSLGWAAVAETARIYLLPCIAGHVGADCAAVILSEQPQKSQEKLLVVDVGTNAEIVFGDHTRVLACSSPTGPAFEGAQISAGQRAAPGAIERVEIDARTKEPRFKVVGGELWSDAEGFAAEVAASGVTGICGSGIIEAIAEMRKAGLLDASGLIGSPRQTGTERMQADGRTFSYLLHAGSDEGDVAVCVTQGDVRAVQLAKSALYAGAKLLMEEFGAGSVDRIILAGAFGSHISPLHAMILGMIPDCRLDCVSSAGNAAGTGARMALCSVSARREIERVVGGIEKIETAVEPKFQEHFVNANALPHSVDEFQQLAREVTLPSPMFNRADGESSSRRRRRR
ncbi:MAG: ASKHA domain-containing protein [Rhodobacteraceae bacterium]|nr:ASKHA domain-containing protein [Paracoccaceae bacterium]